jgi:uncharacterized Fe-S cluster-containing radical SAM superfamily protein
MAAVLDSEKMAVRLRAKAVDVPRRSLLMSKFGGSAQESDLSRPVNCGGFGRVHEFKNDHVPSWPWNPLPMEPASRRLNVPAGSLSKVQVFQNSVCNWRCWYCYVPYRMLGGNAGSAARVSADELVGLYLAEEQRCLIIDCSGGQPDLTPEWVPWMMDALRARHADDAVYLWSDDNLSNDYFWRYLSGAQRSLVREYRNYGRGCCFKGFDRESFAFNTKAAPELFDQQFELLRRHLDDGIDVYAYATFTAGGADGIGRKMAEFCDRLQAIHRNLPLQLIPLPIERYGVVARRVGQSYSRALEVQEEALRCWLAELDCRFSPIERAQPVTSVSLAPRP